MEITIKEELSDNFGEKNARVISMVSDRASMDFVIRKGNYCSVSHAKGDIKGLKDITLYFIEKYKPETLTNQVHKITELRAMYKAGFRVPRTLEQDKPIGLKATLELLEERQSILMAWKGVVVW